MSLNNLRCYRELIRLKTFDERFEYLKLKGIVGEATFGYDRYLNQLLYTSGEWRRIRRDIILRDNGCDLAVEGYDILDTIIVHHMNPISVEDLIDFSEDVINPEYLICVSHNTHNAIHYGDKSLLTREPIERKPGDTCPWKQ